jgi:hypothetical protein
LRSQAGFIFLLAGALWLGVVIFLGTVLNLTENCPQIFQAGDSFILVSEPSLLLFAGMCGVAPKGAKVLPSGTSPITPQHPFITLPILNASERQIREIRYGLIGLISLISPSLARYLRQLGVADFGGKCSGRYYGDGRMALCASILELERWTKRTIVHELGHALIDQEPAIKRLWRRLWRSYKSLLLQGLVLLMGVVIFPVSLVATAHISWQLQRVFGWWEIVLVCLVIYCYLAVCFLRILGRLINAIHRRYVLQEDRFILPEAMKNYREDFAVTFEEAILNPEFFNSQAQAEPAFRPKHQAMQRILAKYRFSIFFACALGLGVASAAFAGESSTLAQESLMPQWLGYIPLVFLCIFVLMIASYRRNWFGFMERWDKLFALAVSPPIAQRAALRPIYGHDTLGGFVSLPADRYATRYYAQGVAFEPDGSYWLDLGYVSLDRAAGSEHIAVLAKVIFMASDYVADSLWSIWLRREDNRSVYAFELLNADSTALAEQLGVWIRSNAVQLGSPFYNYAIFLGDSFNTYIRLKP